MLATTSSGVARSVGLICFLLLAVIYLLRIRNEDDQAILDYPTSSEFPVVTATVKDADLHRKGTTEIVSIGRHGIGNSGLEKLHSHEDDPTSHKDDEPEFQSQAREGAIGEQIEHRSKYHTKVFGTPWGSGGQLRLKKNEDAPGHKKNYGTPVESLNSAGVKPGRKRAYHA